MKRFFLNLPNIGRFGFVPITGCIFEDSGPYEAGDVTLFYRWDYNRFNLLISYIHISNSDLNLEFLRGVFSEVEAQLNTIWIYQDHFKENNETIIKDYASQKIEEIYKTIRDLRLEVFS